MDDPAVNLHFQIALQDYEHVLSHIVFLDQVIPGTAGYGIALHQAALLLIGVHTVEQMGRGCCHADRLFDLRLIIPQQFEVLHT